MRVKRGATLKGHQPYEILINKLIDGLETPEIVKSKTLPRPDLPEEENFVKNVGNSDDQEDSPDKMKNTDKTNGNIFVRAYT